MKARVQWDFSQTELETLDYDDAVEQSEATTYCSRTYRHSL